MSRFRGLSDGKIVFRNNHLPSTAFWRANSLDTRYLVSDMAKNNVVRMPFPSDQEVIYFGIGGKQYLLRIPHRSGRTSGGLLAPVVVINHSTVNGGNGRSIAAAVESNATTHDHHVPENALAAGLTPDNLPSVEK